MKTKIKIAIILAVQGMIKEYKEIVAKEVKFTKLKYKGMRNVS